MPDQETNIQFTTPAPDAPNRKKIKTIFWIVLALILLGSAYAVWFFKFSGKVSQKNKQIQTPQTLTPEQRSADKAINTLTRIPVKVTFDKVQKSSQIEQTNLPEEFKKLILENPKELHINKLNYQNGDSGYYIKMNLNQQVTPAFNTYKQALPGWALIEYRHSDQAAVIFKQNGKSTAQITLGALGSTATEVIIQIETKK